MVGRVVQTEPIEDERSRRGRAWSGGGGRGAGEPHTKIMIMKTFILN